MSNQSSSLRPSDLQLTFKQKRTSQNIPGTTKLLMLSKTTLFPPLWGITLKIVVWAVHIYSVTLKPKLTMTWNCAEHQHLGFIKDDLNLVHHLGLDLGQDIGLGEDQEHLLCEGLLGLCICPCPPLATLIYPRILISSYPHILISCKKWSTNELFSK